MPHIATPACAGAVSLKSGGFKTQHNRTTDELQFQPCADERTRCLAGPRFERHVVRVHSLGPRPLGELLAEIAAVTGQHVRVVDLVEEYAQLDPGVFRFLGGDKFPPMPLGVVW